MLYSKLVVFLVVVIAYSTALPTNQLVSSNLRNDFKKLVDLKEFINAIRDRLDVVRDDDQSTTAGMYTRQNTIVV